jgi:hypothetical protein
MMLWVASAFRPLEVEWRGLCRGWDEMKINMIAE